MEDRQARFERAIDKIIRRAMDEGKFDNLPGRGKPLPQDENPFEDPEMRVANRMLRDQGFAPEWIEQRKDIESKLSAARSSLERAWRYYQAEGQSAIAKTDWERAVSAFREEVEALNRHIRDFNLKAPTNSMHVRTIDAEKEISQLKSAS